MQLFCLPTRWRPLQAGWSLPQAIRKPHLPNGGAAPKVCGSFELLVELQSSGPTDLDRLGVQAGAGSKASRHTYAQLGEGNALSF